MAGKDIIAMTQEELKRLHVVRKAMEKAITQAEAAKLIGVSLRQFQRLIKSVREEGDEAVIHKGRGSKPNNTFPVFVKERALRLYRKRYFDFGPTLASEKLLELDNVRVNDETLRLWLIENNIPYKKRRKRPHRQWRERRACSGEMVQIDGSHHDWFEGRGPKCVFMGYIDDATGKPFGRFYQYEGTLPAMDSFKRYIKKYGIPLSVYLDKHTTYKSTKKPTIEDQLNGTKPMSQFARALTELGVKIIYANTPQAKGRIERLFNTLQDRLIKEMRLRDISTISEANKFLGAYLSAYARRFSVKPAGDADMHRPVLEGVDLDKIFRVKNPRGLRNDNTISHNGKLYQVEDKVNSKIVIVEEKLSGKMVVTHNDRTLKFNQITKRPEKAEPEIEIKKEARKKKYKPPADHPWRKYRFNGSVKLKEKEKIFAGDF
jgi:transposase